MSDILMTELAGSQSNLAPVAPSYLGCLCIQAEVGDNASQRDALRALEPRLMDAMRQWLASQPDATPEGFVAALDAGHLTALTMGFYPRSEAEAVLLACQHIADVLRRKPAFAATLGISQ